MDGIDSFVDSFHYSYNTYNYLAFILPLSILSLSCLILVVSVYVIILVGWPLKKNCTKLVDEEIPVHVMEEIREEGHKIPCWTIIYGGLKLIYESDLAECKHPRQTNIYTIHGRHVRPWLLAVLFMVLVFIFNCTLVGFWCEFLIEEGTQCTPEMDCFARNKSSSGSLIQKESLGENCSMYENQSFTIQCFKFSFDYATAMGNAGGVMVLARVIMNLQAVLWIGASSMKGRCTWWFSVVGLTLFNIIVDLFLVALPPVVHYVPLFHDRLLRTDRIAVKFYTYWFTFLCTFIISGPLFIIFSKRLRSVTTIDGTPQYVSINSDKPTHEMAISVANSDYDSDS